MIQVWTKSIVTFCCSLIRKVIYFNIIHYSLLEHVHKSFHPSLPQLSV